MTDDTARRTERTPVYQDTRDDRVGALVSYDGKHYRLRSLDGQSEWSCPVAVCRQTARYVARKGATQ